MAVKKNMEKFDDVNVKAALAELRVPEISLSLAKALINLMSASEVISNIDLSFKQYWRIRIKLLERLKTLCDADARNLVELTKIIAKLFEIEDEIPSLKHKAYDDTLSRLVICLPVSEQLEFVERFIHSSRASLRKVAFDIISRHYQPIHKKNLHEAFLQTGDETALATLAIVDADIADIAEFLLQNLPKQHLQARVFEKLFSQSMSQAMVLCSEYPVPFAWGAARARCKEAVPKIVELIQSEIADYENPGVMFWALSVLGAKTELLELSEKYKIDIPNFPHIR